MSRKDGPCWDRFDEENKRCIRDGLTGVVIMEYHHDGHGGIVCKVKTEISTPRMVLTLPEKAG